MAEYFANDLTGFATQAVSNILWGCAVLNFYDQDMFNAAALEIQRAQPTATTHLPLCGRTLDWQHGTWLQHFICLCWLG